ncbi:YkgJ family cysteine cluster protein [Desulfobacterota bacterium M19]
MATAAEKALRRLERPLLPLISLIEMLYLTGPFAGIGELLAELPADIDTNGCHYTDPAALIYAEKDILREIECLKNNSPLNYRIVDGRGGECLRVEAVELWIAQRIMSLELEEINSLLCGGRGCDLCCTGPGSHSRHNFFDIPLTEDELNGFAGQRRVDGAIDGDIYADPAPLLDGRPFYQSDAPFLLRWRRGWSMVLPSESVCPNLAADGFCAVYEQRPEVCRKPQIFPYVLEEDGWVGKGDLPRYVGRRKLLAVWDCPYVREYQTQIARYGELCGMEPIFKENKA